MHLALWESKGACIKVEQRWIPLKGKQRKVSPQSHHNNKLFFKGCKEHCHENLSSLQTPGFSVDGILEGPWSWRTPACGFFLFWDVGSGELEALLSVAVQSLLAPWDFKCISFSFMAASGLCPQDSLSLISREARPGLCFLSTQSHSYVWT